MGESRRLKDVCLRLQQLPEHDLILVSITGPFIFYQSTAMTDWIHAKCCCFEERLGPSVVPQEVTEPNRVQFSRPLCSPQGRKYKHVDANQQILRDGSHNTQSQQTVMLLLNPSVVLVCVAACAACLC